VVRIALEQFADTLELPVGEAEGGMQSLLLGERGQSGSV